MKVAVLGTDGMLGHKMFQSFHTQGFNVYGFSINGPETGVQQWKNTFSPDLFHIGLDLLDVNDLSCKFDQLRNLLLEHKHDFIINCIGVTKQLDFGKQAFPSIMLNSLLPHLLAEWAREWGGRLINFSTDCVFSGRKGNYSEDDASDAEDLYGKSKYLGEVTCENTLTIRKSLIGRELKNYKGLLEWFIGNHHKSVSGFQRHLFTGVTTNFLSELIGRIIRERPDLNGLYHVASTPITKYELLLKIRDIFQLDIQVIRDDKSFCDRRLNGDRFIAETGFKIPDWDSMLLNMQADTTPYDEWRQWKV